MAKVALLIGVSEYEVGLNPLPAAMRDVVALQRVLKDSEMGDFDEVKILTNPEPQAMQFEVETLFSGRSKDDFVLLFFSGHGIKDDSNNLYFATRITKKSAKGDLIRSTAVPARFVHEVMNNSSAKRQAIILDCCFSGAFDPALQSKDDGSVDLQGQLGAEGRVVLTSSSSTQYSFEQQGSDLSLYTRYLIEGIETGAGDHDEDGKISVQELHEYATGKVHETAPNMTPKLITLKDMGFDLVLAKAKVTDPKLRYRRQVERHSSHGAISSIGRTILDRHRTQLSLSAQITNEIETEVLRPYQERLDNIQRYQQAFEEAVKNEYPLSNYVQSELEDLLEVLGLRHEDVDSVEQEIITGSQAAREKYQQDLERQKLPNLEQQRQRDAEREKLDTEAKLQALEQLQSSYTPTVQADPQSYAPTNVVTPPPTHPVHSPTVVSDPNQTGNQQEVALPQPDINSSSKSNNLPIFITVLLSTFIAAGGLYTMSISRQNNRTNPSVTNPSVTNPSVTNPSVTNPSVTNPSVTNTFGNAAIGGNPGSKNIRTGSGTEFPTVKQVPVGERVEITGVVINKDAYPWFKIRTSSRVEGLIACQLIDCDPSVRFCEKCPPP